MKRTVFSVERHAPSSCPACQRVFFREGDDYEIVSCAVVRVEWGDGGPVARDVFHVAECAECGNKTAFVLLEGFTSCSRETVQHLMEHLGFQNLVEVEAEGDPDDLSAMGDVHTEHTRLPDVSFGAAEEH